MKLNRVGQAGGANLALLLQGRHRIHEPRLQPWLVHAARVPQRNQIGGRFFDDAEAIELQLPQDRGFAGAGSAGEDVAFHLS